MVKLDSIVLSHFELTDFCCTVLEILPYEASIDISELITVDQVMEEFGLVNKNHGQTLFGVCFSCVIRYF